MEWKKLGLITGEEYPFDFGDYVAFRWPNGHIELGRIAEGEHHDDGTCSVIAVDRFDDLIYFEESESYLILPKFKEAQHDQK